VDLVQVTGLTKPRYESAYDMQDYSENGSDFSLNKELLQNAFRSGYFASAEQFKGVPFFPYREDNKAKMRKELLF